jgi:hypothetical protein
MQQQRAGMLIRKTGDMLLWARLEEKMRPKTCQTSTISDIPPGVLQQLPSQGNISSSSSWKVSGLLSVHCCWSCCQQQAAADAVALHVKIRSR